MQTHPRPSQEIAEAMVATLIESRRRSNIRHACLLIGHNADAAGIAVEDYMVRKPTVERLELRGTGGDEKLAKAVNKALARLP